MKALAKHPRLQMEGLASADAEVLAESDAVCRAQGGELTGQKEAGEIAQRRNGDQDTRGSPRILLGRAYRLLAKLEKGLRELGCWGPKCPKGEEVRDCVAFLRRHLDEV